MNLLVLQMLIALLAIMQIVLLACVFKTARKINGFMVKIVLKPARMDTMVIRILLYA